MELSFWHERWQKNEIGFHEAEPNAFLQKHFKNAVAKGSSVFVPLCGKTTDIHWLVLQGYDVFGAELSEIAVEQLFDDLKITAEVTSLDLVKRYRSDHVTVFVGDIFDLNNRMLGKIDCVYDRAALVALPEETRNVYTRHVVDITKGADQFVVCFEYDQTRMNGPPFSINRELLEFYYSEKFEISLLEQSAVEGKLKSKIDAMEHVWWLEAIV